MGLDPTFDRALVVGVGLVGGSWALALRRAGFAGPVIGFERPEAADVLRASGIVDLVEERVPNSSDVRPGDLVVLAMPVGAIVELLRVEARGYPAGALVTDVGSTKRVVVRAADGLAADFVGGHPMAGSERSGVEAARADLFDGAPYFLCAPETESVRRMEAVVAALGATPVVTTPAEHDRIVAFASHLPQLVSSALAATLTREELVGGPGLTDMTRLAASSWSIWRDILMTNRDLLGRALDETIARLTKARDALLAGDERTLEALFLLANDFEGNERQRHEDKDG